MEDNQQLKINNDDYKIMFEQCLEMMFIGSKEGNILKVNNKFADTLGYNVDEMVGRNCYEFIHPGDMRVTYSTQQYLDDGMNDEKRIINFTNRYLKKNGSYIPLTWKTIYSNK